MTSSLPQYSRLQILGIWAAAAVPMGLLGWVINPLLAGPIDGATGIHGTARIGLMLIGLIWQFVLVILLLRREIGTLSWPVVKERLWLGPPRKPGSGKPAARLWFWLALLIPLFALSVLLIAPLLDGAWLAAFPFLAEPPEFSLGQLLAEPGIRALAGAWWLYALFLLLALFNTVLGEELLFRGILLPRMEGSFGRWDWVANGVLFGIYHVHQPWGIPSSVFDGALLFALPARRYRCAWLGIAVHSTQSVYFALVLLPAFLGKS
jgi:membrane protease YdiL (CAAX protease family)